MEQTGQKDLFEIKLNESGRIFILKFAFLARIIIVLGIIISLIHIASTVIRYIIFDPSVYSSYPYLLLENSFLPYYTVFYCILFYTQMYFYWQLTKYLRKGLKYKDEQMFNRAFRSLFRFSAFGVASMILSLLSYGFELFVFIKYYLN